MVYVNREFWALPVFAGISLGFASWLDAPVLWFLVYASLACMAVSGVYRWRNWRYLKVNRNFETTQRYLEAGSSVVAKIKVEVTGGLPWPWIELKDSLPSRLAVNVQGEPGGYLVWAKKNQVLSLNYTIDDLPRGIHRWESVDVQSGDPLGLVTYQGRAWSNTQLIVYPKTINLKAWQFFPRRVDGNASARHSFSHDLSQLVGVRDYQPGDRLSLIHWKSSAKTGKLHSKEFSPLLTDSSMVVLDCSQGAWEENDPAFEEAVKVAASLMKAAWLQRMPVVFYSNQHRENRQIRVNSQGDYNTLLLHLAGIEPTGKEPLSQSIFSELMTQGTNIVVITPVLGGKLQRVLYRMSARGNIVTLIRMDREEGATKFQRPKAGGNLNIFNIKKAEELAAWGSGRSVAR